MGVTERRLREKEQRRTSIVHAAERVFFSKGVETATMDEIAEAAEISKGLLYVYFQSKDDLYNAVCLRGMQLLRAAFEQAVAGQEKGLRKAHAIGQAYVMFAQNHPGYFTSVVHQAARNGESEPGSYALACDEERDEILYIVANSIRCGIADGSIRPDLEPVQTAIMLWGQMHGIIQVASLPNIQSHYETEFNQLIKFAFGLITASLRRRPDKP